MRAVSLSVAASIVVALFAWCSPAQAAGQLSGSVAYPDGSPGAGVEVYLQPDPPPTGAFVEPETLADAAGRWSIGSLAPGNYRLYVSVLMANGDRQPEANRQISIGAGDADIGRIDLSGPVGPGEGYVAGTARAGDAPLSSGLAVTGPGWLTGRGAIRIQRDGSFRAAVPAGVQVFDASSAGSSFDVVPSSSVAVTVRAGEVASQDLAFEPLAVSPGGARNSASDLAALNAERVRWGLPGGIALSSTWSEACGSHDRYLAQNHVLQHPENPSRPGATPGGHWAGTNSILSGGGPAWSAAENPWEDAPIHLMQLYTPNLTRVGIDESSSRYTCTTTWPGIVRGLSPVGTVTTYPGNGTTGLPPAEYAAELPEVPGKSVGILGLAGRELFVYQERGSADELKIKAASLTSARGAAAVKWVDQTNSRVGSYLTGGIVIPVKPLLPNTTYTAQVTLAGDEVTGLPEATHRWSFRTGPANPSGQWGERAAPLRVGRLRARPARIRARRRGHRKASRTTFSVSVSREAKVVIRLERRASGHTTRGGCHPGRPRARQKRCRFMTRVMTLSQEQKLPGRASIRFSGRKHGHALRPGRYRATAEAVASGERSNRSRVWIQIVR